MNVEPNCIELQASDLSGPGLESCVAGEQAEVNLMPRDALGNANASLQLEDSVLNVRIVVEGVDGEPVIAAMTNDVSKPGRLKVCLLPSLRCAPCPAAALCSLPCCCVVLPALLHRGMQCDTRLREIVGNNGLREMAGNNG